jgi:hypothetical protein
MIPGAITATQELAPESAALATDAKPKRIKRTNQQMADLLDGVHTILGEYDEPITIRHLFYRCANSGMIGKTEKEYDNLRSHLAKWRRQRLIQFDKFIDATRFHYGEECFNDLGDYLEHCAQAYRLNLWRDSGYHVEVWVEKDAVAAMVSSIAQEWNLKTFVGRGDPSMSSLHSAARTFNAHRRYGRTPVILYIGDYDESGLAIPKTIKKKLLEDHNCEVEFYRVGIIKEHILQFNLPTRPAKGDRRGESIEYAVDIDAMKPADIRAILSKEIESYIDPDQLERMRLIEVAERETLESINLDDLTQ